MKAFKKYALGAGTVFGAVILLVCAPAVRSAVAEGMRLSVGSVIPSLFVFAVVSHVIVRLNLLRPVERLLAPLFRRAFGLPPKAATALLLGVAGGYPLGAQTVAGLYASGGLSKREAEYALGFCNNCGVAYVVSVMAPVLGLTFGGAMKLYAVHLTAALAAALLLRPLAMKGPRSEPRGRTETGSEGAEERFSEVLADAVGRASLSMLKLCGYICLFYALVALLARIPLPALADCRALLFGCFEMSSGVSLLGAAEIPAAAFLAGFGGLCVACQAASFASPEKLRLRWYFVGKGIQGLLSAPGAAALF